MKITKATAQGQRPYQEDRFVAFRSASGTVVAVADGHGGTTVSDHVVKRLPTVWRRYAREISDPMKLIKSVFHELDLQTAHCHEGSTLSLAYIPAAADTVHVGVLGDSPVIILAANGGLHIGPMHNARSNPTEREAAQKRGAFFDGGYIRAHWSGHGIQMTRVFGDTELSRVVNREPEVYSRAVGPDSFLLVGSDGLFDPSHKSVEAAVKSLVLAIAAGAMAQKLVDLALAVPTHDNVTAILVRFGNQKTRRKKTVALTATQDDMVVSVVNGVPTMFPRTMDQAKAVWADPKGNLLPIDPSRKFHVVDPPFVFEE